MTFHPRPLPHNGAIALIEPSLADAIAAIEQAADLPDQKRRHWACSLRQVAKWLGRPAESIPGRWTAICQPLFRLHHEQVGTSYKNLANHRSNARAALQWFGAEKGMPARGAPLSTAWAKLREQLTCRRTRATLSSLMRFCSAREITPAAVNEAEMDAFMDYRAATTALAVSAAARRKIARAWNGCRGTVRGWPDRMLVEPPLASLEGPAWTDFPEPLRAEIDAYLGGLKKDRKNALDRRVAPCSDRTISTRRAELIAFSRRAVRLGVPIESLTGFAALLSPAVVEKVITDYWDRAGDTPRIHTIELSAKLLSIAREAKCLDAEGLTRLDEIRADLWRHHRGGLTDKNIALVRQVLSDGVWNKVTTLPDALMRVARSQSAHAPIKAAVTAQLAVAIAILVHAPVRLGNLVHIRIGENLIKPGGPDSNYWLVFPNHDVKNRVDLQFVLTEEVTKLIDEYVSVFRPKLVRGGNEPWLFPGETGSVKTAKTLSEQIGGRVYEHTGVRMTTHQFRHAAAATILKHHPGDYEYVRRILGHKNIQTTIKFYCGLETTQASRTFNNLIARIKKTDPEDE